MRTSIAEFLRSGTSVPFALRYAERAVSLSVSGGYNEASQQWVGADAASALTLTLTATPQGPDRDMD